MDKKNSIIDTESKKTTTKGIIEQANHKINKKEIFSSVTFIDRVKNQKVNASGKGVDSISRTRTVEENEPTSDSYIAQVSKEKVKQKAIKEDIIKKTKGSGSIVSSGINNRTIIISERERLHSNDSSNKSVSLVNPEKSGKIIQKTEKENQKEHKVTRLAGKTQDTIKKIARNTQIKKMLEAKDINDYTDIAGRTVLSAGSFVGRKAISLVKKIISKIVSKLGIQLTIASLSLISSFLIPFILVIIIIGGAANVINEAKADDYTIEGNAPVYDGEIVSLGGDYCWPLPGRMTISSDYNVNRGSYKHGGIDIPTPLNSEVLAAADGFVVSYRWWGGGGNTIEISCATEDGNLYMQYMHLNSSAVVPGDKVKKGQVIGYSGNTGESTGPHLHFQVNLVQWGKSMDSIDPKSLFPNIMEEIHFYGR